MRSFSNEAGCVLRKTRKPRLHQRRRWDIIYLLLLCVRTVPIYPEASNTESRARLPTESAYMPLQVWNADDNASLLSLLQKNMARMACCPFEMEDGMPRSDNAVQQINQPSLSRSLVTKPQFCCLLTAGTSIRTKQPSDLPGLHENPPKRSPAAYQNPPAQPTQARTRPHKNRQFPNNLRPTTHRVTSLVVRTLRCGSPRIPTTEETPVRFRGRPSFCRV